MVLNVLFQIPGSVQPLWAKAYTACWNGKSYTFSSI